MTRAGSFRAARQESAAELIRVIAIGRVAIAIIVITMVVVVVMMVVVMVVRTPVSVVMMMMMMMMVVVMFVILDLLHGARLGGRRRIDNA